MKTYALILLLAICFAECRKVLVPINKNANIDFINMETGGARPAPQAVPKLPVPGPSPTPQSKPAQVPTPVTQQPPKPVQPTPPKPVQSAPSKPVQPAPSKPVQPTPPNQIKPVPVNPKPVANPITTPGPGSVQSLINFYDSQGKASPIRPYSYSQAVKQG